MTLPTEFQNWTLSNAGDEWISELVVCLEFLIEFATLDVSDWVSGVDLWLEFKPESRLRFRLGCGT